MPRGSKSKYTTKQKRMAGDIEKGYEKRGVPEKESERRAWATVNKKTGGAKKTTTAAKGTTAAKKAGTAPKKTATRSTARGKTTASATPRGKGTTASRSAASTGKKTRSRAKTTA